MLFKNFPKYLSYREMKKTSLKYKNKSYKYILAILIINIKKLYLNWLFLSSISIIILMFNQSSFFTATKIMLILALIGMVATGPTLLAPEALRSFMWTQEIDGTLPTLVPDSQQLNSLGKVIRQDYTIQMQKQTLQLLPKPFPKTELYTYCGYKSDREFICSYPGPAVLAKTKIPVRIKWVNNIYGNHILPMDFSNHFGKSSEFTDQVPVIPHLHGGVTDGMSDGFPLAYWSRSGIRGPRFDTLDLSLPSNMALFQYSNEQAPGTLWYHDHVIGNTRLNVYAGLAGLYQIGSETKISEEINLQKFYGKMERKYYFISDKSFYDNGKLFYPDAADHPSFETWVPQFFGNTILVNGAVWPKTTVWNKKYRFVFLNACNSRYLDIRFENSAGVKLPFDLIKADQAYFKKPITVNSYFMEPSARVEIVIDFSAVTGSVIIKNVALGPHPNGDVGTLVPQFTGQIMKIDIKKSAIYSLTSALKQVVYDITNPFINIVYKYPMYSSDYYNIVSGCTIQSGSYPAFTAGTPVYYTLIQLSDNDGVTGSFIDGVPFHLSQACTGRTFNLDQTYDIHFINLTPDSHPIHIHLINFQKVSQYPFDVDRYTTDYYNMNGDPGTRGYSAFPTSIDPMSYKNGAYLQIFPHEQVFRDVLSVLPGHVYVFRAKFNNIDDTPFTTNVGGDKYVFHCHILEHEDNDMMSTMCIN